MAELKRVTNRGAGQDDDSLSKRYFDDKLEDSGKVVSKADFEKLKSDYYRLKGWD